jgi:hypothetical protein
MIGTLIQPFLILQEEEIPFYTSIFFGFLVMGAIALIEKVVHAKK